MREPKWPQVGLGEAPLQFYINPSSKMGWDTAFSQSARYQDRCPHEGGQQHGLSSLWEGIVQPQSALC